MRRRLVRPFGPDHTRAFFSAPSSRSAGAYGAERRTGHAPGIEVCRRRVFRALVRPRCAAQRVLHRGHLPGRTMTYSDLSELGGHMFECNKVRAASTSRSPPRCRSAPSTCPTACVPRSSSLTLTLLLVPLATPGARGRVRARLLHQEVSAPDHRQGRVHRERQGGRPRVHRTQVDEKDRGSQAGVPSREGQSTHLPARARVRAARPGEKKAFTDVLQFDPATSRNFTQLISTARKELLGNARGSSGAGSVGRSGMPSRRASATNTAKKAGARWRPSRPAAAPGVAP